MTTTHYTVCNFCDSICGLEVEVDGRDIVSIRGDAADPFSKGHICPKGFAHKELQSDPDRLRHPVVRRGDDWHPIGWDEALAEIAGRVAAIQRRHGADAVGLYYGNPLGHKYQAMLALLAFLRALDTRNVYSSTSVDALPRMLVSKMLYGNQALVPIPDIDRTDFFVIMGANPAVSQGSAMSAPGVKDRIRAISARGGHTVLIDPRRTETAKLVDEHLFIRPGTDALLLMAVLHTLFRTGAARPHPTIPVDNIERLQALTADVTPARVAPLCGVPADRIEALARGFAAARSAVWYGRMGTSTQRYGCLATWLIDAINLVTGNFDRPGGAMFTTPAADLASIARLVGETGHFDRWRSRVGDLPEFNGELPVGAMADEIETPGDGQIRAMLTVAGNPVLSNPNGRRLDAAFERLEFVASVDFYINETTRHADIIVPPATPFEGSHYALLEHALGVRNSAHYTPPVLAPEPGTRHDWQILLDLIAALARARGGAQRWLVPPAAGVLRKLLGTDRLLDLLLRVGPHKLRLRTLRAAPHGVDLGALEPRAARVVAAPIDLVPARLADDVPRLRAELDAGPDDGSLLLVSRRTLRSMNSWLHNTPLMVRGKNRCTLLMHPDDAAHRGLLSGARVQVASRVGAIDVELTVSDEMMPGVVCLPYGWGHDRAGARLSVASRHAGASMNDVVDERLRDPVAGTAVLDGVPVAVTAAAAVAPR